MQFLSLSLKNRVSVLVTSRVEEKSEISKICPLLLQTKPTRGFSVTCSTFEAALTSQMKAHSENWYITRWKGVLPTCWNRSGPRCCSTSAVAPLPPMEKNAFKTTGSTWREQAKSWVQSHILLEISKIRILISCVFLHVYMKMNLAFHYPLDKMKLS